MEKTDIYAIALRSEQTAIGLEKEVSASLKQHPSVSERTPSEEARLPYPRGTVREVPGFCLRRFCQLTNFYRAGVQLALAICGVHKIGNF